MSETIVKLYGLNHSGSHYLSWLLNANFKNTVILHSHTGWNHGPIVDEFHWNPSKWNGDPYFYDDKYEHGKVLEGEALNNGKPVSYYKKDIQELYTTKKLPMLILFRNPYTWLYSYSIKHYRKESGRELERAMTLWSNINKNYFDSTYQNKYFIKYEKLRDDTENQLRLISNFLGIEMNENFIDTDKDAVSLAQTSNDIHSFVKSNESDYTKIINSLCEVEKINLKEFSDMFNSLIDRRILELYNKL